MCRTPPEGGADWLKKARLPEAPSLRVVVMYGHDIPTERSYQYIKYQKEKVSSCHVCNSSPLQFKPSATAATGLDLHVQASTGWQMNVRRRI